MKYFYLNSRKTTIHPFVNFNPLGAREKVHSSYSNLTQNSAHAYAIRLLKIIQRPTKNIYYSPKTPIENYRDPDDVLAGSRFNGRLVEKWRRGSSRKLCTEGGRAHLNEIVNFFSIFTRKKK